MHVVREAFYYTGSHAVLERNGSEDFFDTFLGICLNENLLSVFGGPSQMIPEVISGMAGMEDGHTSYILLSPQQSSKPLLECAL